MTCSVNGGLLANAGQGIGPVLLQNIYMYNLSSDEGQTLRPRVLNASERTEDS